MLPSVENPLSETVANAQRKFKKGTARRGTRAWDDAMLRAKARPNSTCAPCPLPKGARPFSSSSTSGTRSRFSPNSAAPAASTPPSRPPAVTGFSCDQLECEDIRERLARIWTAPDELDPARRSAKATREIAARLARLAVSLEKSGHDPHAVATFLMRCLFTMFAEDVGLLAAGVFTRLLESLRDCPEHFEPMVEEVWAR